MTTDDRNTGFATRAVHAGLSDASIPSTPVSVPIHQSSTFSFESADALNAAIMNPKDGFAYSRLSNPTVNALEQCIADLETTEAGLAFASGMAAINAVFVHLLSAGDHVVAPSSVYGGAYHLLTGSLARLGVETTFVDNDDYDAWAEAIRPNTKIVYAETIGNPALFVPDIERLAEIARGANAKFVVDSTFATPYLYRPMEHGADFVVHSASKYLGGHGDLIAGLVVGREDETAALRQTAVQIGGTIAPFVAWLILRGIKTLGIRMERHSATALRLAKALDEAPGVTKVRYPGLRSHPDHARARTMLGGRFGGIIAIEVEGDRRGAAAFVDRLRIFQIAGSLGDTHSLALQPAMTSHRGLDAAALARARISEGFVRLSVGLEDPADLEADLLQGLAR